MHYHHLPLCISIHPKKTAKHSIINPCIKFHSSEALTNMNSRILGNFDFILVQSKNRVRWVKLTIIKLKSVDTSFQYCFEDRFFEASNRNSSFFAKLNIGICRAYFCLINLWCYIDQSVSDNFLAFKRQLHRSPGSMFSGNFIIYKSFT